MIAIMDYKIGNVRSVQKALERAATMAATARPVEVVLTADLATLAAGRDEIFVGRVRRDPLGEPAKRPFQHPPHLERPSPIGPFGGHRGDVFIPEVNPHHRCAPRDHAIGQRNIARSMPQLPAQEAIRRLAKRAHPVPRAHEGI